MEGQAHTLILVAIALVALVFAGAVGYFFYTGSKQRGMRALMANSQSRETTDARNKKRTEENLTDEQIDRLKAETKKKARKAQKKVALTLDDRMFQAGLFTIKEQDDFKRLQYIFPPIFGAVTAFIIWNAKMDSTMLIGGTVVGLILGFRFPTFILDRKIKNRSEEIMYYLPLVIEQIAIGVSSSLDIGPCIARVVQMADERDTHNAVTELMRYIQHLIKSGMSFEDAVTETALKAGQNELKHCLMQLVQVAKHGGELSKQLQELADAVAGQRETNIEGKIKKLELVATGPVGLVFVGFMIIILAGFGVQMKGIFH